MSLCLASLLFFSVEHDEEVEMEEKEEEVKEEKEEEERAVLLFCFVVVLSLGLLGLHHCSSGNPAKEELVRPSSSVFAVSQEKLLVSCSLG